MKVLVKVHKECFLKVLERLECRKHLSKMKESVFQACKKYLTKELFFAVMKYACLCILYIIVIAAVIVEVVVRIICYIYNSLPEYLIDEKVSDLKKIFLIVYSSNVYQFHVYY